jgi:hypothetical protein
MPFTRFALIAATALATACASDGTTSPTTAAPDARLSAVATVTSVSINDASSPVMLRVAVTSTLTEQVSAGSCAQLVQARTTGGTTWTDVTTTNGSCSTNILLLAPGATVQISGSADVAKLRTVAATGSTVVVRVRHTLDGASSKYTLQSNEVNVVVP